MRQLEREIAESTLDLYVPEILVGSSEGIDAYAANQVVELIKGNPNAVLTLPTGSTPESMYEHLVAIYKKGDVSFHQTTVFNLDEYWPLSPAHPASYASYMRSHFIDQVDVSPENWYIPNSAAADPERETKEFDALMQRSGGVDLAILGIGPGLTCHIGFNERGSTADSRTRLVELDSETIEANRRFFSNPAEIPTHALTQGVANILEARKILLLVKGGGKAAGIARALTGEVSSDAPASFLRFHPNVTFVVDYEAASKL